MKGGKSNGLFRDKSIKKINENYLGGKFDEIKKTNCIGYCFNFADFIGNLSKRC